MALLTAVFESILRHPRRVLALYAVVTAAAVPGLARLTIDNSPEAFFVQDAGALTRYQELQHDFGPDRALRLVAWGPGLWTREGLDWLGRLEEEAARPRGVLGTAGLRGHHEGRLGGWPPTDLRTFRAEAASDVLDRDAGWMGGDGETASVLAVVERLRPGQRRWLLGELEALLASPPPGVESALVGLPRIEQAFDDAVARFAVRFFPLLVLAGALLLTLALGRPADAVPPLLFVAVCQIPVFGALGAAGIPVDMIRMLLVPLLFVIPLATAVHVWVRFRRLREGLEPAAAVRATWREKSWPVVWTGVTTAAGLGSLTVAAVPPVRSLGLWSAAGLGWMTLAALTFFPALLTVWPGGGAPSRRGFEAWARRWGRDGAVAVLRRPRLVRVLFLLATLAAGAGVLRLRQESRLLTYLPARHPVRAAVGAMEARGLGVVTAELVLSDETAPFARSDSVQALARLTETLRGFEPVLGAVSAGDVLASELRWSPREAEDEPAQAVLDRLREERGKKGLLLAVMATRDGRRARVSVILPILGYRELAPCFERLRTAAREAFPGAEVELTGRYPMILAAQQTLLRTMISSLGLTLAVVAAVFLLVLRNLPLTLRALMPNLWPVVAVLGAMGWLGVPLDSTTIMIAAVVLGLAVDDTLHTLGAFRGQIRRGPRRAVVTALERTVPAHLLTSGVLVLGFGICGLAGFLPITRFGALTALALLGALAADLWLVPVLLAGAPRR